MKKNKKTILIASAIVLVLVLFVILKLSSSGSPGTRANLTVNAALSVKAHILEKEVLDNKVFTNGSILANEEVQLMSEVAGKIVKIYFKEGSFVKAGDLLIKINDSELQAQLGREKYRLKLLEDKEYRQKKLLEKEAISQEDYDVALNEVNVSKAESN
jgi:membrane fusion protein (multidrug efflux system)